MSPDEREALVEFLREGVPPVGTRHWDEWKRRAAAWGPEAPCVFLEMLAEGRPDEQYGSLIALRLYAYEAWGEGTGGELHYRVRAPASQEWSIIRPRYPDDPGHRSADESWIEPPRA